MHTSLTRLAVLPLIASLGLDPIWQRVPERNASFAPSACLLFKQEALDVPSGQFRRPAIFEHFAHFLGTLENHAARPTDAFARSPLRRRMDWSDRRSWSTMDQSVENIREVLRKNRPALQERYDRLDRLSPSEVDELRDDVYAIREAHFDLWGIQRALEMPDVTFFEGDHIKALQAVFPKLNLNPRGFRMFWKNEPESETNTNIYFVFERLDPLFMETYNRWDDLTKSEQDALRERMYSLTAARTSLWGLGSLSAGHNIPQFENDRVRALQAAFPKMQLNPLGFKLNWTTPAWARASVSYILEKRIPRLLEDYRRMQGLHGPAREALRDSLRAELYRLQQDHFLSWGLGGALSRKKTPFWKGSYIYMLQDLFSDLQLNPLGFRPQYTTPAQAVASMRFYIGRHEPELLRRYDRIDSMSEEEVAALRRDIYHIRRAQLEVWGLVSVSMKHVTPYFHGNYREALAALFDHPRLGFSIEDLRRQRASDFEIRHN